MRRRAGIGRGRGVATGRAIVDDGPRQRPIGGRPWGVRVRQQSDRGAAGPGGRDPGAGGRAARRALGIGVGHGGGAGRRGVTIQVSKEVRLSQLISRCSEVH